MRIHRSNRADVLASALADVLRARPGDPIAPTRVVVSGRAAERWVSAHAAQALGVVANVRFLSPTSWLEETLAEALGLAADGATGWSAARLTWPVLGLLAPSREDPRFAPVSYHLGDHAPGSARAVALARRIAESFERYATARPDLVLEWDAGAGDAADWQPALWRALGARTGAPHLARLARELAARLAAGTARAPERVVWFTHASVPRLHLEVLAALARHGTPVDLFVLTPTRDAGHPLAEALGRQGRDFETLLASLDTELERVDAFVEPAGSATLHALQRDALRGTVRGSTDAPRLARPEGDRSVRVHACHGRMRQVEVLHDELLRLLDEDPTLEPRDVVVLCADVPAFAPLVDAVFARGMRSDTTATVTPTIPVRVADQPVRRENPVADVVLRALTLASARLDAAEVLDLLAVPLVARRFRLEEGERERIRAWVRESGIRWGVDEAHREAHGLPAERTNSWRFGLDRLLLGQAMPGEGRTLFAGVLPYDQVEGSDAELLGRFAEACERIFEAARALAAPRSMAAWRDAVLALVEALVPEDDETAWPAHLLRAAVDELAADAARAGCEEPLELGAVRLLLERRFDDSSATGGFGSGAVTVCALRPGRTVPARVVALLGMDDEAFPRRSRAAGFDIVAREPRPGDADAASDDRQRFLEAVMAATDHLLVLYTGRTVETNEPVPPAVPVGELLDCIAATYAGTEEEREQVRDAVVAVHPLQPFALENFRADAAASYGEAWLAGARRLVGDRLAAPAFVSSPLPPAEPSPVVPLDDIARFLSDPAQALLRDRLQLSLGRVDATVETREPAMLGDLEAWQLRAALLDALLDPSASSGQVPVEGMLALQRAAGLLPHGSPGELAIEVGADEARTIAQAVRLFQTEEPSAPVSIDLALAEARVVGTVGHIWGRVRLRWQPGALRARHLLQEWVRHLALQAMLEDEAPETVLVARSIELSSKVKKNVCRLGRVPDARVQLERLVALRREGLAAPLPYAPATSYAFAHAFTAAKERDEAEAKGLEAARKAWGPSGYGRAECDEPYAGRLHGARPPMYTESGALEPRFAELALAVCGPAIAAQTLELAR